MSAIPSVSDDVVSLSRFRADMARALAKRGKRLLEAKDLRAQVAALEPLEAYFIIKELGVESAVPILRHTSSDQLQAFVDLDCWSEGLPDPGELDAWLAPLLLEGPQVLVEAFLGLDDELVILFLARSLNIYDPEKDEVPEPRKGVVQKTTPDNTFVIEARGNEEREVDPVVLVEALYANDLNDAFRLLMAARWELPSALEEEAFRFRNGRLEDLGFPPPERAKRLLAPPPASAPDIPKVGAIPESHLPALYAQPFGESSLFARVLSRVADAAQLSRIEVDLRNVINSAVIAFDRSPKDLRSVSALVQTIRDTLGIGIEHLVHPDGPHPFYDGEDLVQGGAALLDRWPLTDVFRAGYHHLLELQHNAEELAKDPVGLNWLDKSDVDQQDYGEDRLDRELVKGLLSRPPEHGGYESTRPTARKSFATKREVADAHTRLEAIRERVL